MLLMTLPIVESSTKSFGAFFSKFAISGNGISGVAIAGAGALAVSLLGSLEHPKPVPRTMAIAHTPGRNFMFFFKEKS
jgi:hypothetical protein